MIKISTNQTFKYPAYKIRPNPSDWIFNQSGVQFVKAQLLWIIISDLQLNDH